MGKIRSSDARNQFSDVINRAAYGRERVVLTRRGRELVAVVPIEDLRLLEKIEDMIDIRDAEAALKEVEKEGTVKWEDIKKEFGL